LNGNILSLDPVNSISGPLSADKNILSGLGLLGIPQGLSGMFSIGGDTWKVDP
jgi:hypothetical protein